MARRRAETVIALAVLAVAVVVLCVVGLFVYISVTTVPIHPDASGVPSTTRSAPAPAWTRAVEQGRQIARSALTERNLPGLSVAVAAGHDIVWAEGFGYADIDRHTPITPDVPFRIGTASTVLTSAAAGLLLEQGRLKLDERIETYVPETPEQFRRATLLEVMAHMAGIPSDGGDEGPLFTKHCERAADAEQYFSGYERQLTFEPGTKYRFSRYGWILVSAAIEDTTNEPLAAFMRKQIFAPSGMTRTDAIASLEPGPDRTTTYFPRFAANPKYGPDVIRQLDYSCYSGSSAFASTPSDLVRFAIAIRRGKLLQPATVTLLQTSQRLPSGEETGYGLGWDLETVALGGKPARVVGHDGDTLGGMVSSLMIFPDQDLIVAVISNISYSDTSSTAVKIAEAFAKSN